MSREGSPSVISYCVVPVCAYRTEIINKLFANTIKRRRDK